MYNSSRRPLCLWHLLMAHWNCTTRNLISQSVWEQWWHSSCAVTLRLLVDLLWVMIIKTVCSSKQWGTNQKCLPVPSFCHTMDLQSCAFFFFIYCILHTWTLKRRFSDRLPIHAFTILSFLSLTEPRNILLHWSRGSSKTVINTQKSHHILPAVHCDCLIVNRLTQMKFK